MKEIQKGSIAWISGWWFVVVASKDGLIYSICDNANNRYINDIEEAEYITSSLEAMRMHSFGDGDDELRELIWERPVPVEVIAEVLSGCHDDRFDDYLKK